MLLIIGEVLIDKLPQGHRPGGAPFNVAAHLGRLGLDVALVSCIGCDDIGEGLLRTMNELNMNTAFVQRDKVHSTGCVEVELSEKGIPSYTFIADVAYDHIDFQALESVLASCPMVYFGSLIQRTDAGRCRLQDFLASLPDHVLRLYDMNLRPGCDHADIIFQSLEKTDILKLNDEELAHVAHLLESPLSGDELVCFLMDSYGVQTVLLTRGADSSILYTGTDRYEAPAMELRADEIADTVGAGDSFTAVLAWAFLQGLPPEDLLERGNLLAGRMCTIHGAVPPSNTIYQDIK